MAENMEVEIARLDERLKSIERTQVSILEELKAASESRRRSYESSERSEREIIHLTHRVAAVEKAIEAIRPTTDELEKTRDRVMFTGSLGKALWAIGKAVLAAAAGAAAAYYSITGRPPP